MTEVDKYGRIKNRNFKPQSFSDFPSFNDSNGNFWQRLNCLIGNIGNWMDYNRDSLCTNISIGFYFLCWVLYAIAVILTWIYQDFVSAIIGGIIGGFIVYYGAAIVMFVILFALQIFTRVIRVFFYNIFSLIIGFALLAYTLYRLL